MNAQSISYFLQDGSRLTKKLMANGLRQLMEKPEK